MITKKSLSIFVLLLMSGTLFAAGLNRGRGDVIKGKALGDTLVCDSAKYLVTTFDGLEDFILVLRNVENRDTSTDVDPEYLLSWAPEHFEERVKEIVKTQLSAKEIKLLERSEPYIFMVRCAMNAEGKVTEVCFILFHFEGFSIEQEEFWMNFPVSRFYEIEKAIIAGIDEKGQEWTKPENLRSVFGCFTGVDESVIKRLNAVNDNRTLEGTSVDVGVDFSEGEWGEDGVWRLKRKN